MQRKQEMTQQKTKNEYQEVHQNILYTASWINLQATKLLKSHNISPQQFNILRVLQEQHPAPATVKMLTEKMVDEMSNASRLVEKLKQKGLVAREAADEDRRRVNVYLTPKGLETLKKAAIAIDENIEQKLKALSKEQATLLSQLLSQIRS